MLSFVEEERFNRKKNAKTADIDNGDGLPLMLLKWTFEKKIFKI